MELVNEVSKLCVYKINIQKSFIFYIPAKNSKLREHSLLQYHQK